jgi:hypothetical protein
LCCVVLCCVVLCCVVLCCVVLCCAVLCCILVLCGMLLSCVVECIIGWDRTRMQTISCIGFMQHASALKAAGKLGDAFAARRAVFAKCKAYKDPSIWVQVPCRAAAAFTSVSVFALCVFSFSLSVHA